MRLGNPHIAIDSAAETNGRWVDCPEEWTWTGKQRPAVLICGVESPSFREAQRDRKIDKLDPNSEESRVAYAELIADCAIKGWKNIFDAHGNDLPYSTANARAICLNRDNRRFLDWVSQKAINRSTFEAFPEDDIKN